MIRKTEMIERVWALIDEQTDSRGWENHPEPPQRKEN